MNRTCCIAGKGLSGPAKALFIVLLVLLVGACAGPLVSRDKYKAQLEGWVGKSEAELVEQFGPPQHSEKVDGGTKILSWNSSSKTSQGSGAPVGGGFSIGLSVQSEHTCELSFTVVDGIAKSFDWKANVSSMFGKVESRVSGECGSAFPATPKE